MKLYALNEYYLRNKSNDPASPDEFNWVKLYPKQQGELAENPESWFWIDSSGNVNELLSELHKGIPNGVAPLNSNQKIPSTYLQSIAITETYVVSDISARDNLSVQEGDVAKVQDSDGNGNPQTYIWDGSQWIDIQETSDVIQVNNQTGNVSIGLPSVLTENNTTNGSDIRITDGDSIWLGTNDLIDGHKLSGDLGGNITLETSSSFKIYTGGNKITATLSDQNVVFDVPVVLNKGATGSTSEQVLVRNSQNGIEFSTFDKVTQAGTYAETIPGATDSTYTIDHNLGTTDILVHLWNDDNNRTIDALPENRTQNSVDITFITSPDADVRVVVKK